MPPKSKGDGQPRRTRATEIPWAKTLSLTDTLVAYFMDNPRFRRAYWSDSVENARNEDRTKKTSHDSKVALNKELAAHIFAEHPTFASDYEADPKRFALSTSNRISRLKEQYKQHVEAIGSTGIGLRREDVADGSRIQNLHQGILKTFPWWYDLDSIWHELPNFIPIAVSAADQGLNHAAAATTLFTGSTATAAENVNVGDEEQHEMLADPDADVELGNDTNGTVAGSTSRATTPIDDPSTAAGQRFHSTSSDEGAIGDPDNMRALREDSFRPDEPLVHAFRGDSVRPDEAITRASTVPMEAHEHACY